MAGGGIVVDDDAHDMSVEDVYLRAAADDEVVFVPVVLADECNKLLPVTDRADDLGLLSWADAGNLAAQGVERATTLLVVLAGVRASARSARYQS